MYVNGVQSIIGISWNEVTDKIKSKSRVRQKNTNLQPVLTPISIILINSKKGLILDLV